jgi:hypothetical protein
MTDKYETIETLKGAKVLDINEWIRKQEDDLFHFKQQFNGQTATDEKFFKIKELEIRAKKDIVRSWLDHLEENSIVLHQYNIRLLVSKDTES